jgi:hypothetical protein
MARQWFLPEFGTINEDGTDEYFLPGLGMIDNDQTPPATDLVIDDLEVAAEMDHLSLVAGAVLIVQNLEIATEAEGPISLVHHPAGGRMFLVFY